MHVTDQPTAEFSSGYSADLLQQGRHVEVMTVRLRLVIRDIDYRAALMSMRFSVGEMAPSGFGRPRVSISED